MSVAAVPPVAFSSSFVLLCPPQLKKTVAMTASSTGFNFMFVHLMA
jgi:hypothetical protein